MQFGFTADMDNAELPKPIVEGFEAAMRRDLCWRKPDSSELAAFKLRHELRRNGDDLIAVCDGHGQGAWVLENMWAGFPDPADFVFIGFNGKGNVDAFGFFEDWPQNWAAPNPGGAS